MGSALVLIFLVFPNPLRVPNNDPTASAEYAPVPGRQESAENANFGETGLASSGGIGAGGEGFGFLSGSPPGKPPPQFRPRQLDCVGSPPRQTEDELSPPCVAFFDGDNGDETWEGVTRDEIKIIFYNDLGIEGDMTTQYRPSDEQGDQTHYQWRNIVRTIKAHVRYFQKRFQTYGRRVKVIAVGSDGGPATRPEQRKGEAIVIAGQEGPFAVASLVENAQDAFVELAKRKIHSFGWNEDVPRRNYDQVAPFLWSFGPDQETETEYAASFICRKLYANTEGRYGRGRANHTDDPDLKGLPRKFGLLWPKGENNQRGIFQEQLAELLKDETTRRCGIDWSEHFTRRYASGGGAGEAPLIMNAMKSQGVTTVVCYCIPVPTETTVTHMQNAATSLNYFPEWYWDHASAMDRAVWQQTYGNPRHKGFGVSYMWRQPPFRESYAYRAYLSEEPGTVPNTRFNFEIYHIFLNLFTGIQAAGPFLTPESIAKGMHTFRYVNPSNPWLPTGSYGATGPSPQTFIETAMGWWWDPTGTPPGGREGEGCLRVIHQGRRFYAGGWTFGDAELFDTNDAPCSEDTRELYDPAGEAGT